VTRKTRIDPQLAAAGWVVVGGAAVPVQPLAAYDRHALCEFPTASGPADYALAATGQVLGVVEAKRLTVGPAGVLEQAEPACHDLYSGDASR
jgi:type I restriction enzyme R subunit